MIIEARESDRLSNVHIYVDISVKQQIAKKIPWQQQRPANNSIST